MEPASDQPSDGLRTWAAYGVHVYTASGMIFAFLAVAELTRPAPDPRWVFVWLLLAGLLDATDGPLARKLQVKVHAPQTQGRVLDDIVDYLTFTFVPLLLVWRMDWLAGPDLLWIAPALIASLFGFANTGAKQEKLGFFRGFPSYWNLLTLFIGWFAVEFAPAGRYVATVLVLGCALLTLLPVRFVYPNQAPQPWRSPVLIGAWLWLALLVATLPSYPRFPEWLPEALWIAGVFTYPVFYVALSVTLDVRARRLAR